MMNKDKLGIWMDHSTAHLIEFPTELQEESLVTTQFTHEAKAVALGKNENRVRNKEQHDHSVYFKKLSEIIKKYKRVVLFGPTDAKVELLNLLRADYHFDHVHIESRHADKMTEHQQYSYVRHYFERHSKSTVFY